MAGDTAIGLPHVMVVFGECEEGLFVMLIVDRCVDHLLEFYILLVEVYYFNYNINGMKHNSNLFF